MIKDKLLEFMDTVTFYGIPTLTTREQVRRTTKIRKIIEQHFSISDEERAEAIEEMQGWINECNRFPKERLAPEYRRKIRIFETILKALGEK